MSLGISFSTLMFVLNKPCLIAYRQSDSEEKSFKLTINNAQRNRNVFIANS